VRPKLSAAELLTRERAVKALLSDVAHQMDTLPRPVLVKFLPVLGDAERELAAGLRKFLAHAVPDDKFTLQQFRNALTNVRGAIDAAKKSAPQLAHLLGQGGATAGALAAKNVERELAVFSKLFDASLCPAPIVPAASIAHGKTTLMQRYATSAKRYAGSVGDDIRHQMAIGLVKGETIREMTKRLVGPGSRLKVGKLDILPDAAGPISDRLFNKYEFWASRLIRTEVLNAYNVAADEAIVALGKDDPSLVRRWDSTLDYRTCPACGAMDGEVTGLREPFKGGIDRPPLHPQCRCSVIVWRDDWEHPRLRPAALGSVAVRGMGKDPRRGKIAS
jgi:SPP1 gp7 family putative phage head morphogenesis protein